MKKQLFTALAFTAVIIAMVSCGGNYEAKTVTLTNQNDSLNYAFGVANGGMIKGYYLVNDSTGKGTPALLDALSKALSDNGATKEELYTVGVQLGSQLKQMQKDGFLGEESLTTNIALVKQGFVNGIYGQTDSLNAAAAEMYLNSTMQQIQMSKQAPAAGGLQEDTIQQLPDTAATDEHNHSH